MAIRNLNDVVDTIQLGGTNSKTNQPHPTSLSGYFLRTDERPDDQKESGVQYVHVIATSKGEVGIWGKTNLDGQMKRAVPGRWVDIKFVGMTPSKVKGRRPFYTYEVAENDENTIPVVNGRAVPGTNFAITTNDDDIDLDEVLTAPSRNHNSTSEKHRVDALLNSKRK